MAVKRIAVLGATGHIGRALAHFIDHDRFDVTLVGRDRGRTAAVAAAAGLPTRAAADWDALGSEGFDALVNCAGIGDPGQVSSDPAAVYELTAWLDAVCLGYLRQHPDSTLVNMSSGAVYGRDFAEPARDETELRLAVNALGDQDHYGLAKLASEGRHRASGLPVVDLRVFGFFSRFADLERPYLVNDMVRAVLSGTELSTGAAEIWRDFIGPRDLSRLVEHCVEQPAGGRALDVVSMAPVSKAELLEAFAHEFGLAYRTESPTSTSATGVKTRYYSESRKALATGWSPRLTALEAVLAEARHLLEGTGGQQ
jgi:nucleoside-diphosphate-sugar epimerase